MAEEIEYYRGYRLEIRAFASGWINRAINAALWVRGKLNLIKFSFTDLTPFPSILA